MLLVSLGVLLLGGCGGDANEAAETSTASITTPRGEPIVILTSLLVAETERAEPIATGQVLPGSTLAGSPFCADGTIRDTHGSTDPAVEPYGPVDRTITCADGTVRLGITPEVAPDGPQGQNQTGSWTIVDGTAAFEGLRGSGRMEVVYDPDDDQPARETLTGSVTR